MSIAFSLQESLLLTKLKQTIDWKKNIFLLDNFDLFAFGFAFAS